MTQTEHLQNVILLIAKDVDKLCRENGIEYYLFGGSALGAKRHAGFIPWDDDMDIVLLPGQYERFITLCKTNLDKEKYSLQEGGVDWPEHFSKIRLKGTHIHEYGDYEMPQDKNGIFLDVFRVDYAPNSKIGRMIQFVCGKLILSHTMKKKGYKPDTATKKFMTSMSSLLNIKFVHRLVSRIYYKNNSKPTHWISDIMGRTRWHSAFVPIDVYGRPTEVDFEDTKLFAHENLHQYLATTFGDYMKLPPQEQQVGSHIEYVDFGNY